MEKIKINIGKYNNIKSSLRTRWQDETTKYIKEFGIVKNMQVFVWKKIGKNGKNFNFIESQVAKIKEFSNYYKKPLNNYAGNFINILKKIK